MLTLAQVAVSGLLLGGVYALLAGGLNLVFGVMRVINLAHGEFLMLGAYTTFWLFSLLGLHPVLSLLISVPLMFALGTLAQRFLVGRVVRQPMLTSLLLTFGISLFLTGLAQQLWTNDFRSVPYLTGSVDAFGLSLSRPRLVASAVALLLSAATYTFLRWSRWGKALRATAQNPDAALVCGVDVDRARLIAFALGAALAGAAGTLASFMYTVFPEMGQTFMLKAFAVIVLGGLGSFAGAFLGALLLGLIEAYAAFFTTTQLAEALVYVLLVAVLLFKPSGFFGLREA
ncbi:MAG TPA: branched-chain amino acid ABC transporter permease [Chloroflexota bacterium]|jgi:branched-chain amino acid transport system permease protein|nr:branched-chain amino acid ABC transporter permease [Chloroflexota bacterium]